MSKVTRDTELVQKLARMQSHPQYGCVSIGSITTDLLAARDDHTPEWWSTFIQDVRLNGIREPLVIRVLESGETYLSDGHHRAVAAIELGLDSVPVRVTRS